MIQEETTTTKEMLEHHFDDDKVSFAKIDKRFEKHEELMKINGEHLSYLRKDITELKSMLIEQNKLAKTQNERIEPMLSFYEDINKTMNTLGKFGSGAVKFSAFLVAIGTIIGIFVYVFKKLI